MCAKKGSMPELIFISPIGDGKKKLKHVHTVFEVLEADKDGVPTVCRMVKDDEIIDLAGKTENGVAVVRRFMTGYIQAANFSRGKDG